MIKIGSIITLSNNCKYVISGITQKDCVTYLYLVNTNMKDIKFAFLDNDDIVEIEDKNKIDEIVNLIMSEYLNI